MKRMFILMLACCMAILTACGAGGTNGSIEARFPEATASVPSSGVEPKNMPPESPAPFGEIGTSPEPGKSNDASEPVTALEFLEAYLSAELVLFETLDFNMREHPETVMDSVYLNDASRIRISLKSAVAAWEDDATGTGDTRSRTFITGSTIDNGKPVTVENTFTAQYEANKGRLHIEITDESGKLVSSTQCVKTPYGFIAQYYDRGDNYKGIRSIRILISLRDTDGIVGIDKNTPTPDELQGDETFELPQTLQDWFSLTGRMIKVHSEEGANIEFEASLPATNTETTKMPDQSYLGTWITADGEDELEIYDISETMIRFRLSVFRLADIDGIATTIRDDEILFTGFDPAGNDLYGKLEFIKNTVVLTIDYQDWTYTLPEELTFTSRK